MCLPLAYAYARGVARGVAAYCREQTGWLVHTAADGDLRRLEPFLRRIACDGIISMCADADEAAVVEGQVHAHVLVSMRAPELALPRVVNDDEATGRMAAEFYLRQGRTRFAFVMGGAYGFTRLRQAGFAARIAGAGLPTPRDIPLDAPVETLRALPAGLAVLAANDEDASAFSLACAAAGVRVPDDIAVMGVDDDETYCALAQPALSSIALNTERIGREAAALLDGLLSRVATEVPGVRLVAPIEVRVRASTGLSSAGDPVVSAAHDFMAAHLGEEIGVDQIARAAHLGRRSLENRFRQVLGKGVYRHLMELRVKQAQALLGREGRRLKEVASQCGFSDERAMKRAFVACTGRPPSAWRTQDDRA